MRVQELRAELKSRGGDITGRHIRRQWSLPLFASFASAAFVLVTIMSPNQPVAALAVMAPADDTSTQPVQVITAAGSVAQSVSRDAFSITAPPPPPAPEPEPVAVGAPAVGTPDPGSAQAVARDILAARGLGDDEFACLVALWNKESGWNTFAQNSSSGAYGIPQALPGEKMASAGADWATNPATQITWGLGYIEGRYGTPCGAWATSEAQGWY